MKRFRQLLLWGLLIAVGFFLRDVVSFIRDLPHGYSRLCTLKMPVYDAYIDIYTPHFNEIGQCLLYEVREGEVVRVPMAFFGTADFADEVTATSFTLITGKKGKMVGIAFVARPKEVLIIHDFTTDETWPKAGYSEHFTSTWKRGEALLAVLRTDSGRPDLKLAGE